MLTLKRPSQQRIRAFLARQRRRSLNYDPVGASRDAVPPAGWRVNHGRVRLGQGRAVYDRALQAVFDWRMFPGDWIFATAPGEVVRPGTVAAVAARLGGLWAMNACRVVYVLEEEGAMRRGGFAYGTLAGHLMRGEERFCVEWHPHDDSVWYDVWSFSRPQAPLAWCGCPVIRRLQRRFVRASTRAMQSEVAGVAAVEADAASGVIGGAP